MFIVVYAFDYVDLPQLQDEVREGMSEPGKSGLHSAMPHFQVSKMLATRLVVGNDNLVDHPSA
jgi:hypothetical protein